MADSSRASWSNRRWPSEFFRKVEGSGASRGLLFWSLANCSAMPVPKLPRENSSHIRFIAEYTEYAELRGNLRDLCNCNDNCNTTYCGATTTPTATPAG